MLSYSLMYECEKDRIIYLSDEKLNEIKNNFSIEEFKFIKDNILFENISYIFDNSYFLNTSFTNNLKSKLKQALFNFYLSNNIYSIDFDENKKLNINDNNTSLMELCRFCNFTVEDVKLFNNIINNNFIYKKDFITNNGILWFKQTNIKEVIDILQEKTEYKCFYKIKTNFE